MADRQNSSEDLTLTCQVCFEDFTDKEEHLPRILPCSHTLCEKCLGQLIGGNKLCCPECRLDHKAENGVRSFPQNKYILDNIQQKESTIQSEPQCREHGKALVLYCNELRCRKCICLTCLTNMHVGHRVTEIEDKNKLVLFSKIATQMDQLESSKNSLMAAKEELEKNSEASIAKAAQKKEELIKLVTDRMNTLTQSILKQRSEVRANIDEDTAAIAESIFVLESIGKNVMEMSKQKDIAKSFEIVENIEHNAPRDIVKKYARRQIKPEDVEELCAKLVQFKTSTHVSEIRAAMSQERRKPSWKGNYFQCFIVMVSSSALPFRNRTKISD